MNQWSIENATMVTPHEVIGQSNMVIQGELIHDLNVREKELPEISLDMSGMLVFPGLINAHDHILGNYLPKVGKGPYINWLPWDNDLKSADTYVERQQIDIETSYYLGAYRNLLSGVTTVSDHIPHFVNDPYIDKMPIRIIRDYTLAHSVTSFALKWGEGIQKEYQLALEKDFPFVTHCQEGFDEETLRDTQVLEENGALGEHAALVHCIGLSDEDIDTHARYGSNIIWCPDSNMYMYNRTLKVKSCLEKGINVALGTDSPMSGGLNYLYELKFAQKTYRKIFGEDIDPKNLIEMGTTRAAQAFRLSSVGEIAPGKGADLLFVKGNPDDPYQALIQTEMSDIQLLVYRGQPIYGDLDFAEIFSFFSGPYSKIRVQGQPKIVIGDPWEVLKTIRKAVGYKKELAFLPIEPY